MAKTLTAEPSKLIWLVNLTNLIPPSKVKNALKLSTFRRALKLSLKNHMDQQTKILEIFQNDYKEYDAKKKELEAEESNEKDKEKKKALKTQIEDTDKAIAGLQVEADLKIKEYNDEHKEPLTVTFDHEAVEYAKNVFSESSADLFGQYHRDAEGNVKQEAYNANQADELFELLDEIK